MPFYTEFYHRDVLREDVLVPITKLYFQKVCELMLFLYDGYSNASKEELEKFKSENGITKTKIEGIVGYDSYEITKELFEEAIDSYSIKADMNELKKVLCLNIQNRVNKIEEGLSDIVYDGRDFDETLKIIQFNEKEENKKRNWSNSKELFYMETGSTSLGIVYKKFGKEKKQHIISFDEIKGLKIRSKKFLDEKSYGLLLSKWWDIERNLPDIELGIEKSIYILYWKADMEYEDWKIGESYLSD
ncbi:MAG: hypothetical protein K8E24_012805 [Methanobacterium paludis]|nr:hypothetical protein [Methanobacterium paludis]